MKPGITLSRILVNEALIQLKIAAFNRVFTGVSTPYFDRLHFSLKPDKITAGIQPMRISFPLSPTSSAVWLASFFSPTLYFLLLLIVERLQLDPLPENIIILLFCLIPLVALLVCEFLVWQASRDGVRRSGWMWFTMLGLVFQFGIIIAIVVMATAYF